jgi:hypothetical protein
VPGGPGGEACCSQLLRGRAWFRMMHRGAKLADHGALCSQQAPSPGPLGALSQTVVHSTAVFAFRRGWAVFILRKWEWEWEWPDCGNRPAKANQVSWVGKPAVRIKPPWSANYAERCIMRNPARPRRSASSRLHRPGHLAPPRPPCPQPANRLDRRLEGQPHAQAVLSVVGVGQYDSPDVPAEVVGMGFEPQ